MSLPKSPGTGQQHFQVAEKWHGLTHTALCSSVFGESDRLRKTRKPRRPEPVTQCVGWPLATDRGSIPADVKKVIRDWKKITVNIVSFVWF